MMSEKLELFTGAVVSRHGTGETRVRYRVHVYYGTKRAIVIVRPEEDIWQDDPGIAKDCAQISGLFLAEITDRLGITDFNTCPRFIFEGVPREDLSSWLGDNTLQNPRAIDDDEEEEDVLG